MNSFSAQKLVRVAFLPFGSGDEEHGDEEHGDEEHGDEEHGDEEHGDEEHGDEEHGDEEEREDVMSTPSCVWTGLVQICAARNDAW